MADPSVEGLPVKEEKPDSKTLDFFIGARDGKKRNYIFSYSKAKACPHSSLKALSIGGSWYRCEDCNYAYCIVAGYAQPLHNVVIGGVLNALHFAKEFGGISLGEVLRRPIGQWDGTPHKAVLPEGMTFSDAVAALDEVDVNAPDKGKEQLKQLLDEQWVSTKSRALWMAQKQKALEAIRKSKELQEGKQQDAGTEGS